MEDQLDLIAEEPESRRGGVSIAVLTSFVVHTLLILYLIHSYRPLAKDGPAPPIARYVELMRQQPRDFTEAPGPKVKSAPLTAPYSDANREASAPKATGERPTLRPGDGSFFTPQTPPAAEQARERAAQQAAQEIRAPQPEPQQQAAAAPAPPVTDSNGRDPSTFRYRPTQASAAAGTINWRNAIREVKVADLGGGQQSPDLGNGAGGDKGFAKDGPVSFETQWYDWGEYAESMVSKIRVNWYNNMPQLIQTGMRGVVTIRITIHRSGAIDDITILESSGHPPYDFAAKKAIELSSPLNPLPADFPNATEHVTFMFFYNQEPPQR